MKLKNLLTAICIMFLILFFYWFFHLRTAKESRLIDQGHNIIKKVEAFKKSNHQLPDSLAEIGIIEDQNTETIFQYHKLDNNNYMIWLGISSEESKFYYSDSNKWQTYLR